ncbi:hypothetical protein SPRG_06112 [Saprolegnia parasitica CBS 223.65]|uniref:Uncharacterized protein n=1 Tax=Saprolegnia parasitica (strain CBS 223.65) TaxID=695850 RepID=A0A067CQG2_SAPPC|nr:hypothetical protein SPRG_06112 [Saprolegnia parasitica CBS 223.65]KDO29057.1 hypothetical protein SPRG_06112 [Saprolegnia parasitica CBS 223.65]|eukprot:XP_012200227.1 hypothetical protein SPRG_06112 [Saprolegnia parasitica CBS 223.65]
MTTPLVSTPVQAPKPQSTSTPPPPTTTHEALATTAVPLLPAKEVPTEVPAAATADALPSDTVTTDDAEAPKKDKLRWGKWTREEEAYTTRLIGDFTAGLLTDVTNGTTMRSWLSAKLRCCPMRISKKFVGEQSIGKRMFERNESRINDMNDDEKRRRAAEIEKLHDDFCESWIREEKERLENKANGTRKRKRNKKKDANGLPIPPIKKQQTASSNATLFHGFKPPLMGTLKSSMPSPNNHFMGASSLSSMLHRPSPMLKAPTTRPPFNVITKPSQCTTMPKKIVSPSKIKTEAKPALTIKTSVKPYVAMTPRGPVKRINSVPSMTKPAQAPSLTPTKKATAHASTQIQELQLQLASRAKSLSFDMADPLKDEDGAFDRDFRELDFMSDCWIPEALGDVSSFDPFGFHDANALHAPLKEEELDAALSPTSVMDLYHADSMWPLSSADVPVADVFLAPLYDCLF